MLVIFSDIHLTDGTAAINVAPDAFQILFDEVKNNAINKQVKEIRIIMLGDIFDFVRTDYWLKLDRKERPWNGNLDSNTGMNTYPGVEQHYATILNNILATASGEAFINLFNSLKKEEKITVPVIINYVVGNHDRAFNNYDSLKVILKNRLLKIENIEFVHNYYSTQK